MTPLLRFLLFLTAASWLFTEVPTAPDELGAALPTTDFGPATLSTGTPIPPPPPGPKPLEKP